jgi:hypothetical protein
MTTKLSISSLLALIMLSLAGGSGCVAAAEKAPGAEDFCPITVQDVPRMSVDELNSRLNDPSLTIIDVRAPGDWNSSSTKVKGSVRETIDKIEEWAPRYAKDKNIVLL